MELMKTTKEPLKIKTFIGLPFKRNSHQIALYRYKLNYICFNNLKEITIKIGNINVLTVLLYISLEISNTFRILSYEVQNKSTHLHNKHFI